MDGQLRRLRPDEARDAARRAAVSFGVAADDTAVERWRQRIDAGEVWGFAEPAGPVLAHCRLDRVDHWFGGRRVPCQHVSSVAVPPEHRGAGVGRALMHEVVRRGAADGAGLSLLFPATTRMYRSLGYEHAGTFTRYRLDARQAPAAGPALRPAGPGDWTAIEACAQAAGRGMAGPAVRPEGRWAPLREAAYAYVLDAAGAPGTLDAYVLFDHQRAPGEWQYTLVVADWAATTARGLAAVVGLVGRHGTLGKDATFRTGLPDVWSLLVAEQDVTIDSRMFWMARGLDLPAAVAARGFPPDLSVTTTLRVHDPLLPAADGAWRLEVAGGRGGLEACDAPGGVDVALDARAVGPLFTGFHSPAELALAGLATGDDAALDRLGGVFAGPLPVLLDFF